MEEKDEQLKEKITPEPSSENFSSLPKNKLEKANSSPGIDQPTAKEIIDDNEKRIKKNRARFGTWFAVSMFILNVLVLLVALFLQSRIFGVADIVNIGNIEYKLKYAFLGLGLCIGLMLLEMFQVYVLLFKATKKSHPFISYKCAAMGKYYGSLFGAATGGKPYQMFYLNSKGFSAGVAASVPAFSYTIYQFVFAVVSFVVLITSFSVIDERSTTMLVLSIISLIVTFLMIVVIILMSFSKKFAPTIMIKIVNLLKKMRLIKSKRAGINHGRKILQEYRSTTMYLMENFTTVFVSLIVSTATVVLSAVLPYFIYCMFYVPTSTTFIEIFAKVIICNLAMKYIPLPGGVGIAELSFTVLFSNMFTEGTLFWAMLFWRIFGVYIYIVQGVIFIVYGFIYGRVHKKKKKA